MTTSFTTSADFENPQDDNFGDVGNYPSAFGITFTPKVTGIAIGVGGFLIAGYLFLSYVIPVLNELSELNKQKLEKQGQLEQISSSQLDQIIARKQNELQESKDLREDVINFFASEKSLDTLLLDVNTFTNFSNVKMNSFVPTPEKETVADNSFGSLANNNLQVKNYNVELEGSFTQLQLFLQDVERLQPLLVVKNLNTSTINPTQYLLEKNQLVTIGQPKLKTSIILQAVFPDIKPPEPPPVDGTQPKQKEEKPTK